MAENGYTIGSHTVSHPYLSELSVADLARELGESKQILEENTGQQIKYLAPPGGRYSEQVIKTATCLGYEALVTTLVGLNHHRSDVMQLKRWTVRYQTPLQEFEKMIRQDKPTLQTKILKSKALNLGKQMLGNTTFDKLRTLLLPSPS
jgi:peptidoglycan/xylan/chitin deacetylase (PgdA/CDA1 family)